MSTDVKALLKLVKRRETTVDMCLRGDLAGEYDALSKQLANLPAGAERLNGDPERQRLQAELDRIAGEMAEGTVPFVLRALPQAEFQMLIDSHPPRRVGDDVNEADARSGFNRATFYRTLIPASVVEPALDAQEWALLFDVGLSQGQFMKLAAAAMEVNGDPVDVPFSSAASNGSPAS